MWDPLPRTSENVKVENPLSVPEKTFSLPLVVIHVDIETPTSQMKRPWPKLHQPSVIDDNIVGIEALHL